MWYGRKTASQPFGLLGEAHCQKNMSKKYFRKWLKGNQYELRVNYDQEIMTNFSRGTFDLQ